MDLLTQSLFMAAAQGSPMVLVFDTTLSSGTTIGIPLRGEANVLIQWGDGSSTTVNSLAASYTQHTYSSEGTYKVKVFGSLSDFGGTGSRPGFEKLTKCLSFGNLGLLDLFNAFSGAVNLVELPSNLPQTVTSLRSMFNFLTGFNAYVGDWDTSNVTNMRSMFLGCSSFNQDISNWNTSNVTNMNAMFTDTAAFNQDISNWNMSSVIDMEMMFSGASAFNQDLSGIVTGLEAQPADFSTGANATFANNANGLKPFLADGLTQINT